DPGQFFMIQFDDGCELHRFRQDLRRKKVLAKVNIENPHRIWARAMQEFTNRGAAAFRSLRQRAKTYSMGAPCQCLPLRRPGEKIPGDGLGDFKAWLASMIHLHLHRAGRMLRIFLNEFGREAELSQAIDRLRTQRMLAQTAGWNSFIPE